MMGNDHERPTKVAQSGNLRFSFAVADRGLWHLASDRATARPQTLGRSTRQGGLRGPPPFICIARQTLFFRLRFCVRQTLETRLRSAAQYADWLSV